MKIIYEYVNLLVFFFQIMYSHYYNFRRYRVKWYATPLRIQRIILFLLLKGAKNYTLSVGLFIPSLECFATVRII